MSLGGSLLPIVRPTEGATGMVELVSASNPTDRPAMSDEGPADSWSCRASIVIAVFQDRSG